jgi:hypothetical protein
LKNCLADFNRELDLTALPNGASRYGVPITQNLKTIGMKAMKQCIIKLDITELFLLICGTHALTHPPAQS